MPGTPDGSQRFFSDSHAITRGVVRVWLSGDIRRPDAPALDGALRSAQAAAVITIVDVRAVTAIDATALHLIRAADRRARSGGRRLVILRGSEQAGAEIEALGLGARFLTIADPPPLRSVAAPAFEVVTERHADRTVVAVRGAIDIATGPRLGAALAAARGPVLLDLRGVDFMDATGIRLLLEARARAHADGAGFELIPGAAAGHTLECARLREHFACATPGTSLVG